jgi:hypothetical protein
MDASQALTLLSSEIIKASKINEAIFDDDAEDLGNVVNVCC